MNSDRIKECTTLAAEILEDFELSRIQIENILLKCLRLCRLLNDETGIQLFFYETSGYPCTPDGVLPEAWPIARLAGRGHLSQDSGFQSGIQYAYMRELLPEFQAIIDTYSTQLAGASHSIIPSFPNSQYLSPGYQQAATPEKLSSIVINAKKWYQAIRGHLHDYILRLYINLAYGNIIEDTFTKARLETNMKLSTLCPQSINKFVSVYSNMDSDNPEDWANAVHSCRRILVDLADALYPPRKEPVIVGGKEIKVGEEQYINRLIQFIASKSESETYRDVVGADLSNIGKRLDAINDAVCKGTHAEISKNEASRYIIHTYLLISDIVALMD